MTLKKVGLELKKELFCQHFCILFKTNETDSSAIYKGVSLNKMETCFLVVQFKLAKFLKILVKIYLFLI